MNEFVATLLALVLPDAGEAASCPRQRADADLRLCVNDVLSRNRVSDRIERQEQGQAERRA